MLARRRSKESAEYSFDDIYDSDLCGFSPSTDIHEDSEQSNFNVGNSNSKLETNTSFSVETFLSQGKLTSCFYGLFISRISIIN